MQIIPADQLAVGDVYRGVAFGRDVRGEAYVVTGVRTVRSVETYQVIEATNLGTGNAASINLLRDVEVAKLAPVEPWEVSLLVLALGQGEQLHIVRHDGRFWL